MKRLYIILAFFALFGGTVVLQIFSDNEKAKTPYVEPNIFRPELVKAIDLGLHNAAADVMWLSAIQYFGGGESSNNERMSDYLNFTAEVDPKFSYPYAFGALVLPTIGYVDEGIKLADKGIANGVNDWRIPYYTATTYYFTKNDLNNALKYFDITANTPGVPDGIKKISTNFAARSDKRAKTKEVWVGVYENSNDEVVKKRAEKYILHYEILDFLDQAAEKYKQVYNRYPETTDDLINGKILKAAPEDPFGFQYKFNAEGKAEIITN